MSDKLLSPEGYAAAGGSLCPVCGADWEHVSYGSLDMQERCVSQSVVCNECDAEWYDIYELTGYGALTISLPTKEDI